MSMVIHACNITFIVIVLYDMLWEQKHGVTVMDPLFVLFGKEILFYKLLNMVCKTFSSTGFSCWHPYICF